MLLHRFSTISTAFFPPPLMKIYFCFSKFLIASLLSSNFGAFGGKGGWEHGEGFCWQLFGSFMGTSPQYCPSNSCLLIGWAAPAPSVRTWCCFGLLSMSCSPWLELRALPYCCNWILPGSPHLLLLRFMQEVLQNGGATRHAGLAFAYEGLKV